MIARKNMANMLLDSSIYSTPTTSSPLRRKSVHQSVSVRLSENDDEAERLTRRNEINTGSIPRLSLNQSDKRRSLGLSFLVNMPASQMAERVSQCIKLGTENKINPKNAFSLELIDFMTYMINKRDANMSNLQVASTSLDVSTKIYSFRVDGVHMDILKMAGGLDKTEKDNNDNNNDLEMNVHTNGEDSRDALKEGKKRKKIRNKEQVLSTVEALRTNIETEKPSLLVMDSVTQTTDKLFQVMFPNHAKTKFYHHPYTDVLVDMVDCNETENSNCFYNIPKVSDFSHLEICSPFHYFDFQSWNADDESEEAEPETDNISRFQFDLDASVPCEDERMSTVVNYFDIAELEENRIDKCAMMPTAVQNIVDFQKVLSNSAQPKVSEYSFVQTNLNVHWAGPSHWKPSHLKKTLCNSRVIETCRQMPLKKRKEIELCYNDETIKNIAAKLLLKQSAKIITKSAKLEWREDILTLPPDEHYDISQANKLYLHKMKLAHLSNANQMDSENDGKDSNYFDEHVLEDHQDNEVNVGICDASQNNDSSTVFSRTPFTADNLVAMAKLTNKMSVTYAVCAKKVDMKQLKQSIWKCITKNQTENIKHNNDENRMDVDSAMNESKCFSDIYKELPNILTKTNVESLSFPISFVSLLHLANEKTLKISSSSDMADLNIEYN